MMSPLYQDLLEISDHGLCFMTLVHWLSKLAGTTTYLGLKSNHHLLKQVSKTILDTARCCVHKTKSHPEVICSEALRGKTLKQLPEVGCNLK